MEIRGITKDDFDTVVSVLDRWWGGPSGQRADPIFFYEFGATGLVAEEDDEVVGFLLGFVAPTEPRTGYIHLVGIDPDWRRRGVGNELYARFTAQCRAYGVTQLKAIAAVGNDGSVRFHEALGFTATEHAAYAGPRRPRMVFVKAL